MNLAQSLRSLFARKSAGRNAPARGFLPQLECLTERIMPALTANVVNGVLIVKNETLQDADGDIVKVTPVAGFAGRFNVASVNGILNNVGFGTYDAVGVNSMVIDLGDGNDTFEADGLVLAGGITFKGGNGSNKFDLATSLIGGSVSITNLTNATGTDNTFISHSTINGNVTVNSGLGDTLGQFTNVRILGSLKYTTNSSALIPGNDEIQADALAVSGDITMALANGDNEFAGQFTPVEAGGSFSYTGGTGVDRVVFDAGAIFGTSATIALGDNNNFMMAQASLGLFVGTKLTVTAGAGIDFIALTSSDASRVAGAASFNLGNGQNTLLLNRLRAGSLGLTTGTGDDIATLKNLTVAGGLAVLGGDGKNTFQLEASLIGGSVSVTNLTNTAGEDVITIKDSTIHASVVVNSGLGDTNGQLTNVHILGSLKYTTASNPLLPGADSVLGYGLTVGGNITLALANGVNQFTGAITPVEAGGSFSYTGGAGRDQVSFLSGAIFGASATIALGENDNTMSTYGAGLFVGTQLTVTGGTGEDYVGFSSTAFSRVNRAASFNLGNGTNTFIATNLRAGSLSVTTGSGSDTGTFDNLTVIGAAALNFGSGTNTVNLASTASSTTATTIGGAFTLTTGANGDTIKVGANATFNVGGAAKFTTGTSVIGNGSDSLQINSALFASSLGIFGGSGVDTILLANTNSISIAGKLTVNTNASDDRLDLGVFADANKAVRLLVVPSLIGGAGSGDVIRIFGQGYIQGPPGVVVLPTGPALLAGGWEGLA